jgi:hypothetical protein
MTMRKPIKSALRANDNAVRQAMIKREWARTARVDDDCARPSQSPRQLLVASERETPALRTEAMGFPLSHSFERLEDTEVSNRE